MGATKEDFYEVLGVSRDAKLTDIGRAYNNLKAAMRRDDAPPDPRREALIEEAFQALSDPGRRDAYDASLVVARAATGRRWAGVATGVIAAAAALAWYFAQSPSSPERKPGRAEPEILADAARAVGRVDSFDMSGQATPLGLAAVVSPGVLVTRCQGIAPGAQISVFLAPRSVPARVALADEALGLCKLAVEGAGSWPIAVGGAEPRAGDRVYATNLNPAGELVLVAGTVRRVVAQAPGRFVETSMPVAPGSQGGPLLDADGRMVAVASASNAAGEGRHLVLPPNWTAEERSSAPVAAPAAAPAAEGARPPIEEGRPRP